MLPLFTMNSLHPFTSITLGLCFSVIVASCNHSSSPSVAAQKLSDASYTEIYGFNGSMAPNDRQFVACGPIPSQAKNLIIQYLKKAHLKKVDIIHPQQFIQVEDKGWILCTNPAGQLVGFLTPSDASIDQVKHYPTCGSYQLLVNDSTDAPQLSYQILKSLQFSDAYRQNVRKHLGLEPTVLNEPTRKVISNTSAAQDNKASISNPTPKAATDSKSADTENDSNATDITTTDDTSVDNTDSVDNVETSSEEESVSNETTLDTPSGDPEAAEEPEATTAES